MLIEIAVIYILKEALKNDKKTIIEDGKPKDVDFIVEDGVVKDFRMVVADDGVPGYKITNIKEEEDGSAIITFDLDDSEIEDLIEVGLNKLLDNEIQSKIDSFNKD